MKSEKFGPGHSGHRRVPWSHDLEPVVIQLPSTFIELLGDNKSLSSHDKSLVREFCSTIPTAIQENDQRRAAIQRQIELLQFQLDTLSIEHARLRKQSEACDIILSPFRRVVDDVLHQIIQHSILTPKDLPHVPKRSSVAGGIPLALARVSRQFRFTTQSLSRLWKNMFIIWNDEPYRRSYFQYIKRCGELSNSLPLSIHLMECGMHNVRMMSSTLDSGAVCTLRWIFSDWSKLHQLTRLTITSPRQHWLLQTLQSRMRRKDPLQSLTSLVLFNSDDDGENHENIDNAKYLNDLFQHFSSLRHFRFDFDLEDNFIPRVPSDDPESSAWLGLKTLCIDDNWLNYNLFSAFLLACPNLEAASFRLNELAETDEISLTIIHDSLKELVITYAASGTFSIFVDRRFPALTSLKIQFIDSSVEAGFIDEARIAEVFPGLQHLSLFNTSDIESPTEFLFPFIMCLPTLTHLSISLTPMDISPLSAFLKPLEDGTWSLSKLQHVDLIFRSSSQNTNGIAKAKELNKSILDIRDSRNSASKEASAPKGSQNSLLLSVRFTWTKEHHSLVMHDYFVQLRKELQEDGVGVEVQLEEEAEEEDSDSYLDEELMRYFDGE
ncbi:hypothetical protein BJ165DRAFT_1530623 [Panaeolus papilionaceus]|nr:hypothetical protein BJ165DRAFT_1530623 [Panaeolus papilionaceus]